MDIGVKEFNIPNPEEHKDSSIFDIPSIPSSTGNTPPPIPPIPASIPQVSPPASSGPVQNEPEEHLSELGLCNKVLTNTYFIGNGFAQSLLAQINEKGYLSSAQINYVLGVLGEDGKRQENNPKGRKCFRTEIGGIITAVKSAKPIYDVTVKQTRNEHPPNAKEDECTETAKFPYMNFPFKYFNPVQSTFMNEVSKDNNVVICARTSSGKTTIAEMVISHTISELRKSDPTAITAYIAPLKALCKEKEDDWVNSDHPFSNYNISILTGDYILSDNRKKELAKADIICMSSEMLGSRIRRNHVEKNMFLSNIKTIIIDEAHLICMENRGPNLETALAKFTAVNPDARVIFLSATMPNIKDLGTWLTKINNKETTILKSDYRPVNLNLNYEVYRDAPNYGINQALLIKDIVNFTFKYPNDKFIIFVHAKKMGRQLLKSLRKSGIISEFHCADLNREDRQRIEASFRSREPDSLRILVATSTLAMGINMPARRVIVSGIYRGINEVRPLDITQMCGRAGRLGLDDEGDAHIFIKQSKKEDEIRHCGRIEKIESQINNIEALSFHLVSEIAERNVNDLLGAEQWFKRTLAYHQNLLGSKEKVKELLIKSFEALESYKAIKKDSDGKYISTPIGRISSWFYFCPFDVGMWVRNFCRILQKEDPSNEEVVWAIANTYTNNKTYECKLDQTGNLVVDTIEKSLDIILEGGVPKHSYALYSLLVDHEPKTMEIKGLMMAYQLDIERLMSAIEFLDAQGSYFKGLPGAHKILEIPIRLKYHMPKNGFELVLLPRIGTATAKKLMARRIYTAQDFIAAVRIGQSPVKEHLLPAIIPVAEEIARTGALTYLKNLRKRRKFK